MLTHAEAYISKHKSTLTQVLAKAYPIPSLALANFYPGITSTYPGPNQHLFMTLANTSLGQKAVVDIYPDPIQDLPSSYLRLTKTLADV